MLYLHRQHLQHSRDFVRLSALGHLHAYSARQRGERFLERNTLVDQVAVHLENNRKEVTDDVERAHVREILAEPQQDRHERDLVPAVQTNSDLSPLLQLVQESNHLLLGQAGADCRVQRLGPTERVQVLFKLLQLLGRGRTGVYNVMFLLSKVLRTLDNTSICAGLVQLGGRNLGFSLSCTDGKQSRGQTGGEMFEVWRHGRAQHSTAAKLPTKFHVPVGSSVVKDLNVTVQRAHQQPSFARIVQRGGGLGEVVKLVDLCAPRQVPHLHLWTSRTHQSSWRKSQNVLHRVALVEAGHVLLLTSVEHAHNAIVTSSHEQVRVTRDEVAATDVVAVVRFVKLHYGPGGGLGNVVQPNHTVVGASHQLVSNGGMELGHMRRMRRWVQTHQQVTWLVGIEDGHKAQCIGGNKELSVITVLAGENRVLEP